MPACKSCGAAIVFAHTVVGKAAPYVRDDAAGEWEIDDKGVARHVGKQSAQLEAPLFGPTTPTPRYTSHFAQCPDAAGWRKK